jgi:hypothetical protein
MNVVAHTQQYIHRLSDAAAKIEHPRARRQRFPQPFKKAQMCAESLAPLVAGHYGAPLLANHVVSSDQRMNVVN